MTMVVGFAWSLGIKVSKFVIIIISVVIVIVIGFNCVFNAKASAKTNDENEKSSDFSISQ